MSKRYTDTSLYDREWFQELPIKYKCFWEYICKKCDHAGIWDANIRLASFCIGENLSREDILKIFNGKIIQIEEDKWWIPKFVKFQYGQVLNHDNRVHKSVIKILEKHNLVDEAGGIKGEDILPSEEIRPDDKEPPKKEKTKIKRFISPTMEEAIEYFNENKYTNSTEEGKAFWRYYENNGWKVGRNKMRNWHLAAGNWNKNATERKPSGKVNSRAFIQESHKNTGSKW